MTLVVVWGEEGKHAAVDIQPHVGLQFFCKGQQHLHLRFTAGTATARRNQVKLQTLGPLVAAGTAPTHRRQVKLTFLYDIQYPKQQIATRHKQVTPRTPGPLVTADSATATICKVNLEGC